MTIPSGVTLTVASGQTLYVDGTVSNSGTISGTVSKCTKLIKQEGQSNGEPFNPYDGDEKFQVKYWKTSISTPSISVTSSASHTSIVNGYGETVYRGANANAFVCTTTKSIAINHLKSVKASYSSGTDAYNAVGKNSHNVSSTSCNLMGSAASELVLLTAAGTVNVGSSTILNSGFIADCAGYNISFTSKQFGNAANVITINGATVSSSKLTNARLTAINCSTVKGAGTDGINSNQTSYYTSLHLYDCSSFSSFNFSKPSTIMTAGTPGICFFSGGPYSPSFTGNYHVYGGKFSKDPKSYLASGDLEAPKEGSYWVVRKIVPTANVAKVGTTEYESLQAAVNAAASSSGTVNLLPGIAETELDTPITVAAGTTVTIDLAGYAIMAPNGAIINNGTLYLQDTSTFNVPGSITTASGNMIVNNGTMDVTYGKYTGNIQLNSGTFTTHGGVFVGTISVASGADPKVVANLRGGEFSRSTANFLRDGYTQVYCNPVSSDPKRYWVGQFPTPLVSSSSVSGAEKAWKLDFLSSSDLTLYKKTKDRGSHSSLADWQRRAELHSAIQPWSGYVLDCGLIFDRPVSSGSVTFYGKVQISMSESVGKDLAVNEDCPVLAHKIYESGYTPLSYGRYIDEVGSVTAGVKNNNTANVGTVCTLDLRVCTQDGSTLGKYNKLQAFIDIRYMLGGKKAAIDRNGSRSAFDSLTAAVSAVQDGERILIGADCSDNVTLPGVGTFTVDPYGFSFTGSVSVPGNCFFKSQTEVTSSASAQGVASARAITYVVAQKVARVGETVYDNLAEAVANANGAVVTLLAATEETITLTAAGQSFTLNKNGIEFDDAKVVTTVDKGSVSVLSSEAGTVYTAVTSVVDASDGNKYNSVAEAITGISGDDISVTVTANDTESVELPHGKSLTVTTAPGVTVNLTVAPADGAFLVESEVEGGTKYESKKITVEMKEPSNVASVEMEKIENGNTNTVSDASLVSAAVAALKGNVDVPRTDNTDKLDIVDVINVTPTKIVQEVVGAAAAIIRAATFDVVPTFKAGQSLGEGQKLKFRLPVDAAATQLAAIVYHGDAQFGVYAVQTENEQKFVEVESGEFSPYGYELLDGETNNPVAAIGTTGYATFAAAIAAAEAQNPEPTIIVLDTTAAAPMGWHFVTENGDTTLVRTINYNVWVGGTQISSANAADVFGDGKVSYDDATKTLTLNGYTYSGAGYGDSAVYIGDVGGATFNIVVAGENSLTSTAAYGYAIRSVGTGAVTVTGSGSDPSLALTVPSAYDTGYAVSVKGTSATFKDLSMAVTGYLGLVVNGNNAAGDALTIDNCDVVFDGTAIDQAIWVYNPMGDGTVSIENGSSLTGKGAILVYGYGTSAGDANLSIADSTVNLTGATTASASGSSRHAIEVLSNVGDSVLTIDNSTVTVTASNGLHPNGNGPDGINVGSQNSVSGKGLAKIDIKNGSVVTATGNANGVNLFTWGSSGVNQSGAELSVVDSTLNASATHATGGHYGIVAYAYQKGDTAVVFENSTINASAPASAGIYIGAGEDFNADVGSLSYEAIDSDVTTSGPYGLVVSTVSEDGSNTSAMQTVGISGGSFTCNGLLFVYGDDGENTASVSMSDVTAQIGTTAATEEPVLGTITTGALDIDSGDYTILHAADLDAFDVADGDISGGTFNEEVPEELCADTYIPTERNPVTGKYTVKAGAYVVRNTATGRGYETLFAAVRAASADDTLELLDDVVESITINKDLTLTGSYTITGTLNIDEAATVTMEDITLDANGTIYAINIAGGSEVVVDNVTVGGGTWCNIHLNNGTLTGSGLTMLGEDLVVEADGQHYTYRGELLDASETPPFGLDVTKIPGQTVTLPFMDIVRENGTDTVSLAESLTQGASMLFVANMPGDETQTGVTLPARFGSYSVTMDAVVSVFGDDPNTPVYGWAVGDWNEIIDTGAAVFDALTTDPGQSSDDVDVTLAMNSDVDLGDDPFEFRYENLTIDGGGNTVSGTIKYTDDAGTVENIVMGTDENPLVLDMTEVTEPVVFGDGVEVGSVEIKLTAEQAAAGTPIVTWDAEGGVDAPENESGVSVAIVDASGEPTGDTADLVWDDELGLAYIGPCEARLTGPGKEPVYTTFADAIARAAQSGDTVTLMADISNFTSTQEIKKSLTIDGAGHTITAGVNSEPRSVFSAWGGSRMMFDVNTPETTVTFTDITLDNGESHYFTFLVRAKNGADGSVVFDNVTLLNGGEADAGGTEGVGYGAAVQVDGGNVIVNGDFYADSHGEAGNENGGIFPFTAILYQTGVVHFNDGVTASIGSDLLLVGMEGAVDASTDAGKAIVQEMLDAMNVPAGYAPYTLSLGAGENPLASFTGASPLGWNDIIDYGKDIMDVSSSLGMEMNKDTTPVEVGLLEDTVLTETFTYEDSNFTVNGNGNALSGTIEYTDDAGTLENVVMGTENAPLVLDMTEVTVGEPINLGTGISADNVTIKVTDEQVATMGTTIVTWNTEGQGEGGGESEPFESGITVTVVDKTTGEPVMEIDETTGEPKPKEASLVWDDEYGRAYVGPCEARLTGPTHAEPIYSSLARAIELAEMDGDTVTLMMDIANFTGTQNIYQNLTLDGAGHSITAAPVPENGYRSAIDVYARSNIMLKLQTGTITIRNITLDGNATHGYTYLVSADNNSVSLTTENVRLLNGGELLGDENGAMVGHGTGYGAAIHLNNGATLVVSNGFYACTGGKTAGSFPFTGILIDEYGANVSFELVDDSAENPKVGIGSDLLLIGVPGDLIELYGKDGVQNILDSMKVPARFIPYTLTLGDSGNSGLAFTGASPLGWNEIIDYGKEIMGVAGTIGYDGMDTNSTPVEVGLLTDTILPDTFTFADTNLTVNGNGNALSGEIEYTDNAGLIEDIVMGTESDPLVLNMTNVSHAIEFGAGVEVTNVTIVLTESQATAGTPIIIWDAEGGVDAPANEEGVKVTVVDEVGGQPTGEEAELIWDDEMGMAYIGPCDARLTGPTHVDPIYTTLSNAVEQAAASGDTVTLMTNVTLTAEQTIDKSIVFNLNGKALVADGDALRIDSNAAVQMFGAGIVTGNVFVASGTLTITNGVYIGTIGKTSGVVVQIVISGGFFQNKVLAEYCAEGYFPTERNSDGLYTVTQGYAKGNKPVIAGADTHALTKSEADFLNSLLVKGYDKATKVDVALADASSIGAFRDAAMLNIDIIDYAEPVFRISAIKRDRRNGTVTVTVSLDRHGKEVSKKIYGTLVLRTSSDAHAWSSCTGAVADDASDDDLANFSVNGSTVNFTMPISGNGHIFKATISPVED